MRAAEAKIRAVMPDEAEAISALALRAKAHWGYPDEFREACRAELTYSAAQIDAPEYEFRLCEVDGRVAGFYAVEFLAPGEAELEALFVEPEWIGRGIGRRLIEDAKRQAASRDVRRLLIQGDPHARKFYEAAGGVPCGERESGSIPGRFLPIFRVDLSPKEGAVPDIQSSFVVVNRELKADVVPVTGSIWSDLDERYGDFAGHSLIASFTFDDDWPTWEIHPAGDEFVCLLSGDAELILNTAGGDKRIRLNTPGAFVIIPQGTWHTAKVHAPTSMLFVTPGQGTENRERPPGKSG